MGAPASGQSLVQRNLLPNLLKGQLLDLHRRVLDPCQGGELL